MKRYIFPISIFVLVILITLFINSCNNEITEPQSAFDGSTYAALRKITDNSPSVNSFTPNYNEEEAMAFSNSMAKEIYPFKVGQKMTRTSRVLTLQKDSTKAVGTLVDTFEGQLIIAGTFQKPTIGIHSKVDTVIEKSFTTTISRLIKYERVDSTGNDTLDWKIVSISLPAGGTEGDDLTIQKLTLTAQDSTSVVIENPNAYFFDVGKDKDKDFDKDEENEKEEWGDFNLRLNAWFNLLHYKWWKLHTWFKKHQRVTLSVEVLSNSSDPDVLTLTYGASVNWKFKSKVKFDLVSTAQEGTSYRKVYETKWYTNGLPGRKHAVINALPRYSVYDSDSTVVEKTWGIPYKVQ